MIIKSKRSFFVKSFLLIVTLAVSLLFCVSTARAACSGSCQGGMNCLPPPPSCTCFGSTCISFSSCTGASDQTRCTATCDTAQEAHDAVCGSGGSLPSCPGSCDNSTCATNGNANCMDFNGFPQKCLGQSPYLWHTTSTCSYDYSTGLCTGRYCAVENPDNGQSCAYLSGGQTGLCQGSGCHFTPSFNNCASTSTCTNGTCLDPCGETTACGIVPYYSAIAPINNVVTADLQPDFVWVTNNTNGSNVNVYTSPTALADCIADGTSGNRYNLQSGAVPNGYTLPTSSFHCSGVAGTVCPTEFQTGGSHSFLPNRQYAWLVYGLFPDGYYRGTTCQSFWTPNYTCTVSLSTTNPIISVGGVAPITATVVTSPAGTIINNIVWTSSTPTVGTIPSPTTWNVTSNNVTGVSQGGTNISATVNLFPTGSCSTTSSLPITVLPASWWQVSGGDVYGATVNSQIPATCTQNCYIDLAY